jgi:hypothetical protein
MGAWGSSERALTIHSSRTRFVAPRFRLASRAGRLNSGVRSSLMLKPRTLRVLVLLIAGYGLLLLPAAFVPSYLDSPIGVLLVGPMLSIYLFHKLGVPGLLEHEGFCGWGWCSPTPFGWTFIAAIWLLAVWLMAWGIASLTAPLVKR